MLDLDQFRGSREQIVTRETDRADHVANRARKFVMDRVEKAAAIGWIELGPNPMNHCERGLRAKADIKDAIAAGRGDSCANPEISSAAL